MFGQALWDAFMKSEANELKIIIFVIVYEVITLSLVNAYVCKYHLSIIKCIS